MSPTIPCAQGVILLGAGVLGKGDPVLPAPGEAVQAGVRGAAPAAHVPLEVTGRWEERGAVMHPALQAPAALHCLVGDGAPKGERSPLHHPQLWARPSSGQEQGARQPWQMEGMGCPHPHSRVPPWGALSPLASP